MRAEINNLILMTRKFHNDKGISFVLEVYKDGKNLASEYDNYNGGRSAFYTKLFSEKNFTEENVVEKMSKLIDRPHCEFERLVASYKSAVLNVVRAGVNEDESAWND